MKSINGAEREIEFDDEHDEIGHGAITGKWIFSGHVSNNKLND